MRFPFDDKYKFDYEEEYDEFRGMLPKMMVLFMEDEMNRESKVGPEFNRIGECQFKPENIVIKDAPKAKTEPKPVHVAPVAGKDVKEEDYIKEIDELRRLRRLWQSKRTSWSISFLTAPSVLTCS